MMEIAAAGGSLKPWVEGRLKGGDGCGSQQNHLTPVVLVGIKPCASLVAIRATVWEQVTSNIFTLLSQAPGVKQSPVQHWSQLPREL